MDDRYFLRFFEGLADAAYLADPSTGVLLEVNEAAARLYGYSRAEMRGLSVSAISDEPEQSLEALRTVKPATMGRRHRRKDGTLFIAEPSVSRIEVDGRVLTIGVVRDITTLTNTFHSSPLMTSIVDLATDRYLAVNDAFCAKLDRRREDIVGRTAVELGLITPAERDLLAAKVMTAPQNSAIDLTVRARSGRVIECRYWGQIQASTEGMRLFAAAEDVTEQRQASRAREEALLLLEKISTRVPGVVYQFRLRPDGTSCFPFSSEAIRDIYRVTPDEVRVDASKVFSRLHPDDLDAVGASIQKSARELSPWNIEYRVKFDDGEVRWLRGNSVPAREADGAVLWHGFISDVTEEKRLQASLAQGERLASMGMLAAGVAHEINNPLAYVLASLEVLTHDLRKLEVLPPEQLADVMESAASALEGVQRIRKISRGLSTFSRVERVEREAVDVNAAIETACTMAHNEVKFRATLVKELGVVPLVLASDGKLAQVFLNLLINASHAMVEGDVAHHRITVRTWAKGPVVFAEVVDTGHGIKPEHLERIFDPFFTTKQVGAGSGLGLSISKSIVMEFGGDLRVESEPGRGARFIVRLPATAQEPTVTLVGKTPSVPRQPRGRILVVDDEEAIRRTLQRLVGARHEVVTAGSGREGRALLERDTKFDVVLCDLMMPEMTGMELHAWLVGHSPELAERVVFVSGGAFTPSADAYLQKVNNPKLEKPFDVARLLALLDERVTNLH